MKRPLVRLEFKESAAFLRLNDPDNLNAVTPESAKAFSAALKRVLKSQARALVISGEGKVFSAGGGFDFLSSARKTPRPALRRQLETIYRSFLALRESPQITIAEIHGAAVGGGLGLALACDLRLVESSTRLIWNFPKLGLPGGMGLWTMTEQCLGDAKTRQLMLLGGELSGTEFHRAGAALHCAKGLSSLHRKTAHVLESIRHLAPAAIAEMKRQHPGLPPHAELKQEAAAQARALQSPDLLEGLRAIREKRPPNFS